MVIETQVVCTQVPVVICTKDIPVVIVKPVLMVVSVHLNLFDGH